MNKLFFASVLSLCLCATILVASPVLAVDQQAKPQATRLLAWNGWNKTVSWFKSIIIPKKTTTTSVIQVKKTPAPAVPVVKTPPAVKILPVVKTLPVATIPIETISNVSKEEPKAVVPKIDSTFEMVVNKGAITTSVEIQTVQTSEPRSVAPIDIGGLRDNVNTQSFAISDNDEVVGCSLEANNDVYAFYWKQGKMSKLRDLDGIGGSAALAINDKSQIVGYSNMPVDPRDFVPGLDGGGRPHAVLWENGKIKDLGTFAGSSDLYSSTAYDINNLGQIVGELTTNDIIDENGMRITHSHAVLWDNGTVSDLGTFGGDNSRASSINDSGKIVGYADAKNGRQHAFLWFDGIMHDLSIGTPFVNGESRALKINNKNQIIGVGSIKISDTYWISKSFFWENGIMKIIEDGGRLKGLNDKGQILSDWGLIDNWSLQPFKYGDDLATGWAGFFLMNFNNKGSVIAGKNEEDKNRNYPKHGLIFQAND